MKKIVFALGLAALTMVACKKDDPAATTPAKGSGSFTYDGNTYALTQGTLDAYGGDSGVYNIDINLASSGLTLHEVNGKIDSVSGVGHVLFLALYTSNATTLQTGSYNYDGISEFPSVNTFTDGTIGINANFQTEDGTFDFVSSGTVTITSATRTSVAFTFTGMTESQKTLTANFSGSLPFYDYSASGVAPFRGPISMVPKEF